MIGRGIEAHEGTHAHPGGADVRERMRLRGFTLMEMLLVIVIIGILAGAVVTSLAGRSQDAMITRAKSDVKGGLSLALDLFEQDFGRYPADEEGLKVLVEDNGDPRWKGPYLKSGDVEPDPWGVPYQYSVDPENPRKYVLKSGGPDGRIGTEDDIEG